MDRRHATSRPAPLRPLARAGLAALATLLLGMSCGGPVDVRVTLPATGTLVTDGVFQIVAEVKPSVDPASVALRVDGVDLIGGLGLSVPFVGASGTLPIGPDTVQVSSFDYDPPASGSGFLFVDVSGLSPGLHDLRVEGLRLADSAPVTGIRKVTVSLPLQLEATHLGAAGAVGQRIKQNGGAIGHLSVGGPFAAAPVVTVAGDEIRQGFTEAAEARIAGGTP